MNDGILVHTVLIKIYTRTSSTTAAYDIYRYWQYMIGEAAHAKTRLHYTHVVYIQKLTHIHRRRWNCTFMKLCSEHASTFKQHKWHTHVKLLLKLNIINLSTNHVQLRDEQTGQQVHASQTVIWFKNKSTWLKIAILLSNSHLLRIEIYQ